MNKHWTYNSRKMIPSIIIVAIAMFWTSTFVAAQETFSYSYGDPSTPLNDGYIVSTSNAEIFTESPARYWKPIVGSATEATTTAAEIIFHFPLTDKSASIELSMSMPTFHWDYSRGHNFLYGSTDGASWEQLADVTTPGFGSFNDLGVVAIPDTLLGADDFWLKAELYSFGSSAASGGIFTNTAQLSRYDSNTQNTSFSLNITSVPEPTSLGILTLIGGLLGLRRRRR